MKTKPSQSDTFRLILLLGFLLLIFCAFFLTPSLRPASLLTVINLLFLGPVIHFLTLRKIPRMAAILIVFVFVGLLIVFGVSHLIQGIASQWSSFTNTLPVLGEAALLKLNSLHNGIQNRFGIEINLGLTNWLIKVGKSLQDWAIMNAPGILGDITSASLFAPLLTFFILKDGEKFKTKIQKYIPTSYSATTIKVVHKISTSLEKFLRAKLFEAFLVFLLTYLGFKSVGTPYAVVFALIAGVTNIIPYLGPFLGALPALLMVGFSDQYLALFWPSFFVLLAVNLIDNILIFPVFVAKLVDLSPLTLLVAVALGQEFYGLIGMLVAVPLASFIKIISQEIIQLIYE